MRTTSKMIFALALLTLAGAGGCASQYTDSLDPHFTDYKVQKIGIVMWCSQYVADDPAWMDLPPVDPADTHLDRIDSWDKFLTPSIAPSTVACLQHLGYQPVSLGDSVNFGSASKTAGVLAILRKDRPDIDSVLFFSYVISPFQTGVTSGYGSNEGGVSVNTNVSASESGSGRNYSYYAAQAGAWNSQYFNSIDGLNLRGSLKLVHVLDGRVLWEIGDHSVYVIHSSNLGGGLSKPDLFSKTCDVFGSEFASPTTHRHGIPPRGT